MTTYRTGNWDITAAPQRLLLPGNSGPHTLTNTGSSDVYISISTRASFDTTFFGAAADLEALADTQLSAGQSVGLAAQISSVVVVCATGLTSTIKPSAGIVA